MSHFEVRTDEEGRVWFDMEDPNDAIQRRLHPDTGTEGDELWPAREPEEDAPPLLDLDLAWSEVVTGTPVTVGEKEVTPEAATVEARNAAVMVRELRYHILASTMSEAKKSKQGAKEGKEEDGEAEGDDASEAVQKRAEEEQSVESKDDKEDLKSVYGASVLLKLQWEDRTKQKVVPMRTYGELALFISEITMNLETALEQNPTAAEEVINAIGLDLTSLLLCRYLDGMETCTAPLEECCYTLLTLCVERANPKEMHMAIKGFISKIDAVYLEATSYLILQPLIVLWGKVISRMPRKRRAFLADFIKVYDRLYPCASSYSNSFIPDTGGVGVERQGRIDRIPDVLIDFFDSLIKTQILQRETDARIALEVDMLGREKPRPSHSAEISAKPGLSNISTPAGKESEAEQHPTSGKNASDEKVSEETTDWVCERAMTLARVLQLQGMLWARLEPPSGEDRNVPKSKSKSKKRNRGSKGWKPSAEEKEQSLARSVELVHNFGWSNPVLVCQIGSVGACLEPADRAQMVMREHIGEDIRSKKERKNTLYSISSVGHYLCAALRHGTKRRLGKVPESDEVADHDVSLSGTTFDLLDPLYALNLVLPYLMNLIPQVLPAISMAAIVTVQAFLDRVPYGRISAYDNVLRLASGINCMGREVSLCGLAHHLGKSIAGLDDPKHRRIAYETYQLLLRKCGNVRARYCISESLFYEATRPVLAGQLMTEMKNVLQSADKDSWQRSLVDAVEASKLRSRFAESCFPRYFVPRKELLVAVNPIATAASLLLFLTVSDKHFCEIVGERNEKLREEIKRRMRFSKEYGKLGKECIRALASVAEHDRKNVPTSALAKTNSADAMALFAASGRTLNQCVGALSFVESALESL